MATSPCPRTAAPAAAPDSGVAPRPADAIAATVIEAAHQLHRRLGPGLLAPVYEILLARELRRRGFDVGRQQPVPVAFDGLRWEEGFRADLVVDGRLLVEVKSAEGPAHPQPLLTYLRLMHLPLGLAINFGAAKFADGVKRVVNAADR